MSEVRVRFAPSPTGYLHVGGARTALFNWLWAHHTGGKFLLRIEDTDQQRSTPEAVQAILDGMKWLGMMPDPDEPIVYQMKRHAEHAQLCMDLLERGAAYADFSNPEVEAKKREELTAQKRQYKFDGSMYRDVPLAEQKLRMSENPGAYAIRLRIPEGATSWDDVVHGTITVQHAELDDFVILRRDGTPIYNLAVVSDDHFQRVNLILRGDDHISNTPKQILIYRAMGWDVPQFGHLPMILGPDKVKLSKRHGATAVGDYGSLGLLPEAMTNFLALLGWSTGDDTEVMTIPELISRFSLDRIMPKAAVFDLQKLFWLNGQHIGRLPASELLDKCGGRSRFAGDDVSLDRILSAIELWKSRVRKLDELVAAAKLSWEDPTEFDAEGVKKQFADAAAYDRCAKLADAFSKLGEFTAETTEAALRTLVEQESAATGEKVAAGKYIHPCRLLLTGKSVGPGLFEVVVAIGRDACVRRLNHRIS